MGRGPTFNRFGSAGTFPFSDLLQSKLRPAIVLANGGRGDWILCQVTSNSYADPDAVELTHSDFYSGSLKVTSFARPGKLFTANARLFVSVIGHLKADAFRHVIVPIVTMLQDGLDS